MCGYTFVWLAGMGTLFQLQPKTPQGFKYEPDFITHEEENHLLQIISSIELHTFLFQGYAAKRKVASFGYDYSFDNRTLSEGKPIPAEFEFLIDRISLKLGIHKHEFAELLITEYPVGAVINWHRDAHPFDVIVGLSLLSDCVFRLRPHHKEHRTRSNLVSIPVARRSLYIIADQARSEWQHSIIPVKTIRYSITLRTLKNSSSTGANR